MNKRELLKFVENLPDSVYVSPTRLEESVKKGTQLDIRITISDSEVQKNQVLKTTIAAWFN